MNITPIQVNVLSTFSIFSVPSRHQLNFLLISVLLSTDAESNSFQVRLLAMLNEYNHLRQEKEEEKRRMRVRTTKSYNCIFLGSSLIRLNF